MAVILQLRLGQLMIQLLMDNPTTAENGLGITRRACKETMQKIDWFVEVANRNTGGRFKEVQAQWDDRLASMANLTSFLADHPDGMSSIVDMLTSKSNHREMMWQCWKRARKHDELRLEATFNAWYNETFTTKSINHGPVQ